MLDYTLSAIGILFEWPNPLWLIAGVLFGMIIGVLPGMSGSTAIALLIPLTLTMDPAVAVLFLMAANSPAGFGGMLTSIIVNTPGAPENAATIFDGNPMAKQGRAAAAIGAGTTASVLGGLLGTVILLLLLPVAQDVVLSFSYPEFFMLGVFGLSIIAMLTERSFAKGLIAGGAGLLLAFIGPDPINGLPRFTFDSSYLWDGVNIVPVFIGLFAGAEVLALFGFDRTIAEKRLVTGRPKGQKGKFERGTEVTFGDGVRSTMHHWRDVIRGSLVGTGVGMVPGAGGATAGFLAYASSKRASKHPEEFGKGAIEGVITVEAANDAKDGSTLLPTLAFGIPGTIAMAVLLSAFVMHGIDPGPTLVLHHMDTVYVLLLSMVSAKLIAPIVVYFSAGHITKLTTLRPGIFAPVVIVAVMVGAYTLRLDTLDVVVTLISGYVGYAMLRYGYSRIALCIAIVLGGLMEKSYFQMSKSYETTTAVFSRPISLVLLLMTLLVLGLPILRHLVRVIRGTPTALDAISEGESLEHDPTFKRQYGRIVFDALLLTFALVIFVSALGMSGDAKLMPALVGGLVVAAQAVIFVVDLFPRMRNWRSALKARRSGDVVDDESPSAQVADGHGGGAAGRDPEVREERDVMAVALESRPVEMAAEQGSVFSRQAAIGVWAAGFIVLGSQIGYLFATPIALFLFIKYVAREGYRLSVSVSLGVTVFFYLLFVVILQYPI